VSGAGARPAGAGRAPRLVVLYEAKWGRSLRWLSLALWAASLLGAVLLAASLAEWIPTGDDSWTLLGGQVALLLATWLAEDRRRRHVTRILAARSGHGIVIETPGLFGPVARPVPVEEMALIDLGAPDMHGVMTLRLPGQLRPYRVDTGGEELDIGLEGLPRPGHFEADRGRGRRRR